MLDLTSQLRKNESRKILNRFHADLTEKLEAARTPEQIERFFKFTENLYKVGI